MRSSILSFLEDYARRGASCAFVSRRGLRTVRWSYKGVAETAWRFARELEARGVEQGERVLIKAENSPEWVAAFFGTVARGAVVVPLDAESAPHFVESVRQQTEAKLILLDDTEACKPEGLQHLNINDLRESVAHHERTPYETFRQPREDEVVEIVYTSGTTTEPKGVVLTHGNLLANIAPLESEIEKYLKWERLVHPLRFLSLVPLSHVFGQFMSIFIPQLLGGEVFFQASLNPSEIIETTRREKISVMVAVPRLLDTLRDKIERDWEKEDRSRVRLEKADGWSVVRRLWAFRDVHRKFGWKFWAFISGGATLSADTESFWQRTGFAVIQGYGMTETASLISVNHPFKRSRGSIGRTLPGHDIKLGPEGEIMVRGANVSPGYWQTGAKPARSEDGWLRTGDVGEMDAEGNLYFKGRKKEVIVTAAGLNIYPEDLEAALDAQPEVRSSVVIAIDGAHGPEPLAVLILRDDEMNAQEAIERANRSLATYQQIRRWTVWTEGDFPRTSTMKVRKREIAEILKAKPAGTSNTAPHPSALTEIVARVSGNTDATRAASSSSSLATDLQLDSLGRVELLSALEDRYQVEIDEAAFTAATTLHDVERMIQRSESETAPQYPYPAWARSRPITWIRTLALYLFVLPLTFVMCWVKVRGRENLRKLEGPVLFVSNHISMVDHALILSALPGRFRRRLAIAMEGEILRDWIHPTASATWLTRLRLRIQYLLVVTLFNVFPLPKKSGFRRSFQYAGRMMDRDSSVLVFPEGTRADDAALHPFMTGTGLLAANLHAPIVPIRIHGLVELKQQRKHFARPGQVSIIFGEAVTFHDNAPPTEITQELERRVREL